MNIHNLIQSPVDGLLGHFQSFIIINNNKECNFLKPEGTDSKHCIDVAVH